MFSIDQFDGFKCIPQWILIHNLNELIIIVWLRQHLSTSSVAACYRIPVRPAYGIAKCTNRWDPPLAYASPGSIYVNLVRVLVGVHNSAIRRSQFNNLLRERICVLNQRLDIIFVDLPALVLIVELREHIDLVLHGLWTSAEVVF
jgi:hypothetical protein